MKKTAVFTVMTAMFMLTAVSASAQYKKKKDVEETPKTESQLLLEQAKTSEDAVVITLEQALEIALSENLSVKVADLEIKRTEYAKKGSYAALWPQIDLTGSYQRTIKRQVMYMDIDMSSMMGGSSASGPEGTGASESMPSMSDGMEVGRLNTINGGVTAAMPIVNAQLWKGLKISGLDVELAVEKARASRLDMVTQVKNAYYGVLFAKEAFNVYKAVYENAVENYNEAQKKFDAEKVSEFELIRAKTTVANAIPNVYNAESSIILALWQLKAVLGIDLEMKIDVAGKISDFSQQMFYDIHQHDSVSLENNTTMKQLAIQTEQLAQNIRLQQFANIPTLSLAFNFSINTMANDVAFKQFKWTPYSYVALSLNIPIFAGGKRHQAIRQAKNQHQQVQLQALNTERQLKIAIRQNLTTMETNMKSFYAAQDAVAAAQKAYDVAQASYKVGRSTLIELNDAQLALTQAQLAETQAVYNFVTAKAQLEQTLGQDFLN